MRIAQVGVYSIKELTGKAKERALDTGREMVNDTFDSADLTETLADRMATQFGVVCDKKGTNGVNWSLGYCQGDGVAVYGILDLTELAKKNESAAAIVKRAGDTGFTVIVGERGHGRYHHWNSMTVDVEVDYAEDADETLMDRLANDLKVVVEGVLKDASRDAEKYGYQCIESGQTPEAVEEMLEANETEFDVNGRLFTHPEVE